MSKKIILKGGLWLTAGNALSSTASFLRNILIARFISVEDFGIAALIGLTMSFLEMASNLAVDRLLVQAPDGDDPKLQATSHAFQAIRGIVAGLIILIAADWIAEFFKVHHATWAFQCMALVPVLRGFVHLDITRYQRKIRFGPSVWTEAIPQLISLVLAIPMAWILRDFSVMLWLIIIQSLFYLLCSHVWAERPYQWAWDRTRISRMIQFGWPLLANGFLMFIIFQSDKAIIGAAYSMEVLGWYSAAFTLTLAPAIMVTKIVQSLLLPALANVQNDSHIFSYRYPIVIEFCILIGAIMATGFATLGPELMLLLFGERYKEGTEVVLWLGLTQAIRVAKSGPMIVAMAKAETKNPLFSNLIRCLSLIMALFVASIEANVLWIVVAGFVGEFLAYIASVYLLSSRLNLEISGLTLPFIICLSMTVIVVITSGLIRHHFSNWLNIFWLGSLFLVSIIIIAILMPKTRYQVLRMIKKNNFLV